MRHFITGDLVARLCPALAKPIQIGLVINDNQRSFSIKWTSYDKDFFMEKEEDIFRELNKTFLLSTISFPRNCPEPFLVLLNSNYGDGMEHDK